MADLEVMCDITNKELTKVPESVLQMHNLKMLYLDCNKITCLPEDFFATLPNLTWMDLRDNLLESLPPTIGQHQRLETICLQNNRITHLPVELCHLSTLQVLQISGNPIIYPPAYVVDCGLDDIIIFLQKELCKNKKKNNAAISLNSISSSTLETVPNNRRPSGTIKMEVFSDALENNLTQRILNQRQQYLDDKCNRDKVHKVIKSPSRLTIKSHYKNMNVTDYLPSENKNKAEQVKQMWLEKLKDLISDQEKILQQERAMDALKNWRKNKKSRPKPTTAVVTSPFATNPAFNAYVSRDDVTLQVNKALQAQLPKVAMPDVDTMLKDIMAQLQAARDKMQSVENPEERIKHAEEELKLIIAVHKKVSKMKAKVI